jgi:superoxide dismutase, Fe-Mn family
MQNTTTTSQTHAMPPAMPPFMTPTMKPAMQLALEANFGSLQHWQESFWGMGRSNSPAPANATAAPAGHTQLCFVPRTGALIHRQACDGDAGSAQDGVVLLSVPTPSSAPSDLSASTQSLPWDLAYTRYQEAVHAASEDCGADADAVAAAAAQNTLLDVRRAGMFDLATHLIPGARWHDPVAVAAWAQDLPRDRDVLVYCIYGHEVGRATALRLLAAGVRARYLRGGIDAWQTAGKPVAPKVPTK